MPVRGAWVLIVMSIAATACSGTAPSMSASPVGPSDPRAAMLEQAAQATGGPVVLPLTASKWTEGLSPTYVRFRNDATGAVYTDVPGDGKAWGYAYAPSPSKAIRGTLTATIAMSVLSGAPQFRIVPENGVACGTPAIRPFIFANRNDWGGEFSRWWAVDGWTLTAPGRWTFSIPLTPDRWSSVYGKSGTAAPAQFAAALANVSSLGMTLGGCFYGHGIYATGGTARWTLTSYVVQ